MRLCLEFVLVGKSCNFLRKLLLIPFMISSKIIDGCYYYTTHATIHLNSEEKKEGEVLRMTCMEDCE